MGNTMYCPMCNTELTGAIELVSATVGNYVYIVTKETPNCNWRRCRGCKLVLCKPCDDAQPSFCCEEGRIVARERAGSVLHQQSAADQTDSQPAQGMEPDVSGDTEHNQTGGEYGRS